VDSSVKQSWTKGGMWRKFGRAMCMMLGLVLALALPAMAQEAAAVAPVGGVGLLVRIGAFVVGLALIFYIFYFMVYKVLLKYFHPDYCKTLCISMMLLYTLGWFSFGAFVLFDFGYGLYWLKIGLYFISALWLVWFATVMLKQGYR